MTDLSNTPAPSAPWKAAVDPLAGAQVQTLGLWAASVQTLADEGRTFVADMAEGAAQASVGLANCRSPLDLVVVGQRWTAACAAAWTDAGLRLVLGALHLPEGAAAEAARGRRLPE
jgi:hypothetical protein